MSDVFISYSRRDSAFVQRLGTALVNAGIEIWYDKEDIPRGEEFWNEIQLGIEGAHTLLVLVSENWLSSEYGNKELEYARQLNKRVFPVILELIEGDVQLRALGRWVDSPWEQVGRDNWRHLSRLNWLFFNEESRFDAELAALLNNLQQDQDHIKPHTRYAIRASDWIRNSRSAGYLLAGEELDFAEHWLATGADKTPPVTDAHREYIAASRAYREELIRRSEAEKQRMADLAIAEEKSRRTAQQASRATRILLLVLALSALMVFYTLYVLGITDVARKQAEADLVTVARERDAVAKEREIISGLTDAALQLARNDREQAQGLIDSVVVRYPDDAFAYRARAIFYQTINDPENALVDISRSIELNPNDASSHYARGSLYDVAFNDNQAALEDYNRAIELDPQNPAFFNDRATVYGELGDQEAEMADYERALELAPDYAMVYLNRALLFARRNEFEAALESANRALEIDPDYLNAYVARGRMYKDMDNLQAAMQDFNSALERNPDYVPALLERGFLYFQSNEMDSAEQDYTTVLGVDPTNSEAYLQRAAVRYYSGNSASALEDFQAAQQLNTIFPQVSMNLYKAILDEMTVAPPSIDPATLISKGEMTNGRLSR